MHCHYAISLGSPHRIRTHNNGVRVRRVTNYTRGLGRTYKNRTCDLLLVRQALSQLS